LRSDNQDEKAAKFVVGRRTAERMRDAVAEVFPELEEIEGERPKRWRLPNGLSGIFREPLAQELAALHGVVRRLEREGVTSRPRKESARKTLTISCAARR
jgi:predicted DNA-binding transcriptional regulator YafY